VFPPAAAINPRTHLKGFSVAGWPLDHAKEFLIHNGHDLSGPYIIVQFPSWDRDRREFVPTPLVDLTDRPAENDGGRNRVRASWGLSDAGAMREWLLRFSLGFEGDRAERPLTLRRLDSPGEKLRTKYQPTRVREARLEACILSASAPPVTAAARKRAPRAVCSSQRWRARQMAAQESRQNGYCNRPEIDA
jgi:hypothetical protein